MEWVWIFMGIGANFPSGVFADEATAREWIRHHELTGCLTEYPVGHGLYDWAIERGYFRPKSPSHEGGKFIGRFSSAHLNHHHFENGVEGGDDSAD